MKSTKRLFAILLSATLISTNALADVPNKVAVIGDQAFDLEYVNDPNNVEEIRELLSKGKRVMVKARDQWYDNNGESKSEKYVPPKLIYKNVDGELKEITTDYFDKQVSIVIGIEGPNEIKVIFNDDVDKQLLTKENFKINGVILGEKDELNFDEEKKILTIKVQEEIDLEKDLQMSLKVEEEETVEKSIRVVNSQDDVNDILKSEEFCDIVVMGDDIKLELEGIDGNVFLKGKNIEISNLETTYLQISENSDEIKLKSSKIDNLNSTEGTNVVLEETEIEETTTAVDTEKSQPDNGGNNYVSEWVNAKVKNIQVESWDFILVEFENAFEPNENGVNEENFKVFQGEKELPIFSIFTIEKEMVFFINGDIERVDGEWVSQNKIIAGEPITIKYTANKNTGLKIGSKYVNGFALKSDEIEPFETVDDAIIQVEEGKEFNGLIDNENQTIKIYEEMTYEQLRESLEVNCGSFSLREYDGKTVVLLIGNDGSINEYSVVREYTGEVIVEDVNFYEYNNVVLSLDQVLSAETELESLFRVFIDDREVYVERCEVEGSAVRIVIESFVEWSNDDFVIMDKFQNGNEVRIEYLGGENGLKNGDVEIDPFETRAVVNEDFDSADEMTVTVSDQAFPGEVQGEKIILFKDFEDSISEMFETIVSGLDITHIASAQLEHHNPNYVFFIAADGSFKTFTIVKELKDVKFTDYDNRILKIGEETEIDFINQNEMELSFEVEGDDIIEASMKDGKVSVKAIGEGTGIIRISGQMIRSDGSIVQGNETVITKEIIVMPVDVENVVISDEVEIQLGDSFKLDAEIYPENATVKLLTWMSADESIATVDQNGMVKAVGMGETSIIAESNNGVTAICSVKVVEKIYSIAPTVDGNKVKLILQDINEEQKEAYVTIQNKSNGNISVFNKYDLVQGENIIEFELENGTYEGYMNIDGLKKFKIDTFTVEADN